MKRAALLCLLLAACDQASNEGPSSKPGSARVSDSGRVVNTEEETAAVRRRQETAVRLREQIATANADPSLQRMLPRALEQIGSCLPAEVIGVCFTDPFDVAHEGIFTYYAAHHPEVGLEWVLSLQGRPAGDYRRVFAEALYQRDPELAARLFTGIPPGRPGLDYLRGLCTAAEKAGTAGQLWETVGTSPGELWTRLSAAPGNEMTAEEFLRVLPTAGPWQYPTEVLDHVAADRQVWLVKAQIADSPDATTLQSIAQWLEARPSSAEYDQANAGLALKYRKTQYADALRAAERITNAEERQRVLDQLPGL